MTVLELLKCRLELIGKPAWAHGSSQSNVSGTNSLKTIFTWKAQCNSLRVLPILALSVAFPQIASATSPGNSSAWAMVGTGDFGSLTRTPWAYNSTRDGNTDIVWQNPTTKEVDVWLMTNSQPNSFWQISPYAGANMNVVAVGDMNNDGMPDIVLQNSSTNQITIWYMNGVTTSSAATVSFTPALGWNVVACGYYSGDASANLILQNSSTRQIAVWYVGAPSGGSVAINNSGYIASIPDAGWVVQCEADLDGDNHYDLVFQNTSTNQVAYWYMNFLTISPNSLYLPYSVAAGYLIRGAGDLNNDGKPDLILDNQATASLASWIMGGTGQATISAQHTLLNTFDTPITVTNTTSSSISISWPAVANATSYYVRYGLNYENTSPTQSTTNFTANSLSPGKTYWFAVYAYAYNGTDSSLGYTSISANTNPLAPTLSLSLGAAGTHIVNLSWNATGTSYVIHRYINGAEYLNYVSGTTAQFTENYFSTPSYWVVAVQNSINSANSNTVTGSPQPVFFVNDQTTTVASVPPTDPVFIKWCTITPAMQANGVHVRWTGWASGSNQVSRVTWVVRDFNGVVVVQGNYITYGANGSASTAYTSDQTIASIRLSQARDIAIMVPGDPAQPIFNVNSFQVY